MEDLHAADPRTIGPYRTLSRIGTGGMGVVYLVEDASRTKVALKLLRPELADDLGFRSRFRREVESARTVGGLCNARYLDADLDSDHPYLVTEYVEGGNLLDYVSAHGPLVGDQLVGLAVGLAEALVAMNAVGVIHRDLKPSNVLMAPAGPKVVDFGVSHTADGTALTQTGFVIGSPGWMAPEQALGHDTSPAIDVFAWGATVAFASTGRSPFGEGRPDAVLYRVVHEAPDIEGIDPRLRGLVTRSLEKDPTLRPAADQLLVELVRTAMVGHLPPGGSIAMTTAVLDRTWHQGVPTPPVDDPRNRSRFGWIAVAIFAVVAIVVAGGIALLAHPSGRVSAPPTSRSTVPSSSAPPPVSPATTSTTSSVSVVSAVLPMTTCPTSYGVTPTSVPPLPSTSVASIQSNLVNQLAVYTDATGDMKVIAPTGWTCSAGIGADGSTRVDVWPTGASNPNSEPFQASQAEAVMAIQTGGCSGCAVTQASALFSTAATQCESQFAGSAQACETTPIAETTEPIETGVVGFLDPPGVSGDGNPSGGPYPANGVMTYQSTGFEQSYLETCTLPSIQHSLCTAALDNFVQLYGNVS